MDWLSEHGVILDCYKKKFTVQNDSGDLIEVNSIWTTGSIHIISTIKVGKLLYQEELPRLPPNREVEFVIEVYLGTDPVSIPPYHMSPKELKELKVQLQDLLDREVLFLVHCISENGIRVDPKKIEAIVQWKIPKSVSEANVVADALSKKVAIELRAIFARLSITNDGSILAKLRIKPIMFEQIRSAQLEDDKLLNKREMVQIGTVENFSIDDQGCLRYRDRICVLTDSEFKELILREAYDSLFALHPEGTKMYWNLRELYWWPGMKKDIVEYDFITMDFVTGLPLSASKKNAIWVIVNRLTKSAHFTAVKTDWSLQKLAEVYIREIVRLHGIQYQ
ncbi:uncharacterized protein LOC108468427 [Gossypium arboreum]|uniref:uncharacterized protein LOC108468427 n=1 Tax=Gossypium arboreum TaxID=29729 RepID=UPI0022F162FC|nr:uncharacterized protein LOC108468427 [Gossypium arboreum]